MLVGREDELATLGGLVQDAAAGRSGVLCLHGPAGVGKTMLLQQAAAQAGGTVLHARGVESEAHLAFAALAEMLGPVLDLRDGLPAAQARALGSALALEEAAPAAPFAVASAVLGLLAAAAEDRGPVVVVVDDLQWVDEASRSAVLFAARRLDADPVAVLLGVRDEEGLDVAALDVPALALGGLDADAGVALLTAAHPGLADAVARRLVADTGGNPLALVEIPALLSAAQRGGEEPLPAQLPIGRGLERAYGRRVGALDPPAREALLLLAAAQPGDDAAGLARHLVGDGALTAAERAGLLVLDASGATFRHPLVRSAVLAAAEPAALRAVHGQLADQPGASPDGRAWHRAAAAIGPDADVAAALRDVGVRAQTAGAFVDAAAAFARAADLTAAPDDRARLLLEAAAAALVGGRPALGRELLVRCEQVARDPLVGVDLRALRARVDSRSGQPEAGADGLVAEAQALPDDPLRAGAFLLEAAAIDMANGRMRRMVQRATRARDLAAPVAPPVAALAEVLIAEARMALGESAEADAVLDAAHEQLLAYQPGTGPPEIVAMAAQSATWVERFDRAEALATRLVAVLREAGLVAELVYPLGVRALVQLRLGRLQRARADATEAVELGDATGFETALGYPLGVLAEVEALLGEDDRCRAHATRCAALAESMSAASIAVYGHAALCLLELGRGHPGEAADHGLAAERVEARTDVDESAIVRYLPNLVEALWRSGDEPGAARRLAVLERHAQRPGHTWAAGAALRLRGVLGPDEEVDDWFARALEQHDPAERPFEAARTRLLLGERLRRARRPADARRPLRTAVAAFERLGAAPWAERARVELRAAGGPAASAGGPAAAGAPGVEELTPQELQVALLAAQGQTNREIGAGLFLSPKTVEHHLSRTFRKLGIRRRAELSGALPPT
ncbi:AAA family ATPase [Conexibacter sp. W3-3-2]|uniref:helix-turn-helix transcriptional regulator n=1 Tax=Conexibacter sp. W3-3-2 TaxID=2675227 RepID=UPI0012B83D7F|nr:LuxR family transcriptional regulator [Conexibacter sp. W3-3-2]MTD44812.1 AAA family ATPase [Conexibacter sp. W3-3-2]